jgi:heterotetrameric sarcosine oxidase gamma subunit
MLMNEPALPARAAFTGLALPAAGQRGVLVRERNGLGLATMLARKGQGSALAQRLRVRFGIELPRGPQRVASGDFAFAGIGNGVWLVCSEPGSPALAPALQEALADSASIADQSSGYAVLRMSGPKLRATLAKMLPLDLHSRAFKVGDVASTLATHVGATLWRLPDASDGSPVIEVAVFRSLAESFWHSLATSAAEFGLAAQPATPPASLMD